MLHIRDVEGPKKTGSVETRLEAMEQQVFKCQGMVEHGLNANQTMITEFTSNHKMDAIDIGKHLSRLYDRVDQLQGQIYDLQNQNCEYEYKFKSISMYDSYDSENDFREPTVEMDSGTSPERTSSHSVAPSSHDFPKEAMTFRKKRNSDKEDADFTPEESIPEKQNERVTIKKTMRK
ncbi:40S ribosomal protein S5-1 [Hordeum vulgare]|nr:40S ribosomal protein S5-1 [Hordeum vulgare]